LTADYDDRLLAAADEVVNGVALGRYVNADRSPPEFRPTARLHYGFAR
jgi:hypothetical protein